MVVAKNEEQKEAAGSLGEETNDTTICADATQYKIARSALKHLERDKLSLDDIFYIIEHPVLIRIEAEDPYLKQLYLGFDPKTRALEAVTVEFRDNEETIIHAMKATKEHEKLLVIAKDGKG